MTASQPHQDAPVGNGGWRKPARTFVRTNADGRLTRLHEYAEQGFTRPMAAEALGISICTLDAYCCVHRISFKGRWRNGGKSSGKHWSAERENELLEMWATGKSGGQIAKILGISRSSVLGKIHRLCKSREAA